MKCLRLKLIMFLMVGLGLAEMQAQSLYVNEIVGTQSVYALSDISKLSFASGKLRVSLYDSSSTDYSLDSLHYLTFADSTWVSAGSEFPDDHDIIAYPNPVSSILKIDFSDAFISDGTLNVISVEGRLMQTHVVNDSGIVSIDMSHLPRGIYICRISSEEETESFKIIKL